MPSPFPGMDPYLEDPAFWPDFHLTFIGCWREAVADLLPEPYEARLDERVNFVQMSPEVIKLIYPDVAVSRSKLRGRKTRHGVSTLLLEPVSIPHETLEEVRESRIEILHRPDRNLVAVLEVLSPTNKSGEGFQEYRAKRKSVLQQNVHLVELDLLADGERLPMARPLPSGDYFAFVSRADDRPNCDVYSWTVRDRLPTVPIPLRHPDADLNVDLAKVFQTTYERGRYRRSLFYDQRLSTSLSQKDLQWATELAASSRKRRV